MKKSLLTIGAASLALSSFASTRILYQQNFETATSVEETGWILYHIGLYNDQTLNNNNNVIVHDLAQTDFVVVNYINDYGSNSCHPVCANEEDYYAQLAGADAVISVAESGTLNEETGLYDAVYALYRVDTAITKITVYKNAGETAVETINAVNGDGYWYSIDGLRVAEPTRPGLYIHNGKKIIVK